MPTPPPNCPTCGTPLRAPDTLCPTCLLGQGHDLVAATSLKPGQFKPPPPEEIALLFPEFNVTELLGHGGMGAVYKAEDPNLDRTVAIKILPPEAAADPEFTERFRREAATMARLDNPNIVTLHSFGERQGFHYFIMEYVDGKDLARHLQQNPPPAADALRIASQVCEALNAAHAAGVVHRDIKPANILLTTGGTVKLTDFGLAKLVAPDAPHLDLTRTNTSLGTPRYMAPEQAEATPGTTPDHRVDIYSLGVVLYELLTGQVPAGNFDPPSERNAEVNPDIDRLVLRAMDAEPARRFQSAADLRTALASTVAGKILTRAQHHRRTLTLTAVAATLAAAFGAGIVITMSVLRRDAPSPPAGTSFTIPGAVRATIAVSGTLSQPPNASLPAHAVSLSSATRPFALALHPDGTVTAWGAANYGQTSVPDDLPPTVAIAVGQGQKSAHALALHHDGSVTAWGDNSQNQCEIPADLPPAVRIFAGARTSAALDSSGTLHLWGDLPNGPIPANVLSAAFGTGTALFLTPAGE